MAIVIKRSPKELEAKLNYTFKNKELLRRALTHPSYSQGDNYQKLEFLGDRILGLLASYKIFQLMPKESRGVMARLWPHTISNDLFVQMAKILELDEYVFLGQGDSIKPGRWFLADVFEALVAAVFLDSGWETVEKIFGSFFSLDVLTHLSKESGIPVLKDKNALKIIKSDPRNALVFYAMLKFRLLPQYRIEGQSFNGEKILVGVYLDGTQIALGVGENEKKANIDAAKNALTKTGNLENLPKSFLRKRGIK